MNPVDVVHILEATTGGTRRHLSDLVLNLDRSRWRPALIASTRRDPGFAIDLRRFADAGVPASVVSMRRNISPLRDAVALVALVLNLRRSRPRLVHTHSSKAGVLGRLAARLAGVPAVVHTPHGFAFEMDAGAARRRLYTTIERKAARWTDRLICVSEAERQAALAAGVARADHLTVVRNGIVPGARPTEAERRAWRTALSVPAGAPLVGTIARLTRQKGLDDLVAAAQRLARRVPGVCFRILGEGEDRDRVLAAAQRAGVQTHLQVRPLPPRHAGVEAAFDVFVCPSLWEGMPYTILDAMAAGAAIVASRVGGIPEAIEDGVSGLLTPPRDPAALADAVAALLAAPERRREFGRRARESVERGFRLPDMVRGVERVYEECLAAKPGAQRGVAG